MNPLAKPKVSEDQLAFIVHQSLSELPAQERPKARILREGVLACSNAELLQVLIGGPNAEQVARDLLSQCQDLRGIAAKSVSELADTIYGMGQHKAALLKASFELGKRLFVQSPETKPLIKTPADAAQLLMPEMGLLEQEEVWTVMLDARNRIIGTPTMLYRGCLNAAQMRVGEVFREAIRHSAASIIVAHNHPSTDPSPSADDVVVTKELIKAGKLLDVDVIDHIVVGGTTRFVSLKERGLGFEEG
ncbi:MAG: DNA repair protein RadC [Anaerolineae bacterium]|nr:DNA repair protein RadC [Anaerolineae bacterium]